MVLSCWAKGYQEPLYLVSNMDAAEEACRYYQKRFRIETFFSDQKSRGFHLHKSHISDPQRLSRLLIAACLAYIWIVYLGSLCEKEGWRNVIHRSDRCDVSLFQLGLRLLIGKYLSGLRKFDHVILPKEGFEAQLRASRPSIPFGMSALGMTRQIRDGCLQCGIQARRVPALQGLNKVA
jgi:hypothetical protein